MGMRALSATVSARLGDSVEGTLIQPGSGLARACQKNNSLGPSGRAAIWR